MTAVLHGGAPALPMFAPPISVPSIAARSMSVRAMFFALSAAPGLACVSAERGAVNARVTPELGMERGGRDVALPHEHGLASMPRQNVDGRPVSR